MKKRWKKWYTLAVLLLLIAAALIWQRENIKAGVLFLRYSEDDLHTMITEPKLPIDDVLTRVSGVGVSPLTDEERRRLREGDLTEEDALDIMLGSPAPAPAGNSAPPEEPVQPAAPQISTAPPTPAPLSPAPVESDYSEEYSRIAALIVQVYVMRDSYIAQLEGIRTAAISDYTSLPASERTSSTQLSFALRCIDEATALESVCDAQMGAILSELSSLLDEVGGDRSIASDIETAYAEEKATTKAYYMNLYS